MEAELIISGEKDMLVFPYPLISDLPSSSYPDYHNDQTMQHSFLSYSCLM